MTMQASESPAPEGIVLALLVACCDIPECFAVSVSHVRPRSAASPPLTRG